MKIGAAYPRCHLAPIRPRVVMAPAAAPMVAMRLNESIDNRNFRANRTKILSDRQMKRVPRCSQNRLAATGRGDEATSSAKRSPGNTCEKQDIPSDSVRY
jgi:hypothetical protein